MDTANFLLKRESIQQRMAHRRVEARELAAARQSSGVLGMALKGASLLTRVGGASNGDIRWLRSLLWMLAPAVLGMVRRRKETFLQRALHSFVPNSFLQRIIHVVLPVFSRR
jgi:hypothetical protein